MGDRSAKAWERLGATEPYFAVLTDERFRGELSAADLARFFASGRHDVAMITGSIEARLESELRPRLALDFGCGVGRLTLALAERAERVIGTDVSKSMLAEAERNRQSRDVANVAFLSIDDALNGQPKYDFILSYIVFQHIPVSRGEELLAALLRHLAGGGICALHFTFERAGGAMKRIARRLRAEVPLVHRVAQWIAREVPSPYMQMNAYSRERLQRVFARNAVDLVTELPTNHGGIGGAILIGRKRGA